MDDPPVRPVHHGFLIFDIEGFGRLDRSNPIRGRLRATLYHALDEGMRHARIAEAEYRLSDIGDGALVLLKPHVSKLLLLDRLIPRLVGVIAAHNAEVAEPERLRLRAVVHAGEVLVDDSGVFGEDLNHAFRLLDSPDLHRRLTEADGPVAVIVSEIIYEGIVKHGYGGVEAGSFAEVSVAVKETNALGWVWVPEAGPAASLPTTTPAGHDRLSNTPAPNPRFTGRVAELERIRVALGGGKRPVLALHGLPGVGKSQLAREYADRHAGDYDVRWWVRAEEPATILASLTELARQLGLPDNRKRAQLVAELLTELGRRRRWLLIFDSAVRQGDVARYIPKGNRGHVLITTRDPGFDRVATSIRVEELPLDEAVTFLLERTGSDDTDAAAGLAEELGRLPLALEQAAAYIEQTGHTLEEYLRLYRERRDNLLSRSVDDDHYDSVGASFWLVFERLADQAPAAAQLATLCSFLAAATVPGDLITSMPELLPQPLRDAVADEKAYLETVGALFQHSLVELKGPDRSGFYMHRLVQAVIRRHLPPDEAHAWAERAVTLLSHAWPDVPQDPAAWPRCRELLYHTIVATDLADQLQVARVETARLLRAAGIYHLEQAEPATATTELGLARAELGRAVVILEATCRPDDPEIALALTHLSRVQRRIGDLYPARTTLQRAVRIYEATSHEQPELAAALTYLGATLRDLGYHAEALSVLQRALAIHERATGPDSGKVAWTLTHLGRVLRRLGRHPAAREALERALTIDEALYYGRHDYRIAELLNHLGRVLRRIGDYDGARAALERALSINETVFGPEHHRTAEALIHVGALLRDQGTLPKARELLERALAINVAVYGAEHYVTARTRTHLGRVLRRAEDLQPARATMERALRDTERGRGRDHPQVAWTLVHLSTVLQAQGDLEGARAALERALTMTERTNGERHPDVAWILTHLSAVIVERDRSYPAAARAALERALRINEGVYGADHPDIAWMLLHVGAALQRVGQLREARPLLERALRINEAAEAAYGQPRFPAVPMLVALGLTLRDLGEAAKAGEVLERGYTIASGRLGPGHPATRAAWDALNTL
jgi:tetratricopeptide (TPR) repeat protein